VGDIFLFSVCPKNSESDQNSFILRLAILEMCNFFGGNDYFEWKFKFLDRLNSFLQKVNLTDFFLDYNSKKLRFLTRNFQIEGWQTFGKLN
jgi:hypothetical protein